MRRLAMFHGSVPRSLSLVLPLQLAATPMRCVASTEEAAASNSRSNAAPSPTTEPSTEASSDSTADMKKGSTTTTELRYRPLDPSIARKSIADMTTTKPYSDPAVIVGPWWAE